MGTSVTRTGNYRRRSSSLQSTWSATVLILVLLLVAAACSSGRSPSASDGDGQTAGAPSSGDDSSADPGEPQRGGTLRVAASSNAVPQSMNVGGSLGFEVTWAQWAWPLFIHSPEAPEPAYGLAEGYEVSDDALAHTITLRPDLVFHDGSSIDAEAVVANLRPFFFPDDPLRGEGTYVQAFPLNSPLVVDSVEAVDELTVILELSQPRPDIRRALWFAYILNPETLANPDYGTDIEALRAGGSGPFQMTAFEPGSFAEFERFDGFFDEVYLDRLRVDAIGDSAARALALRSGDIDVAYSLTKDDHEALAVDPGYNEFIAPFPALNGWFPLNVASPAMEDLRVRKAVWHAMNLESYAEAFFPQGVGTRGVAPVIDPGSPAYNPNLEPVAYDPDLARDLIEETGLENITLTAIGPESVNVIANVPGILEAVGADLGTVGIELDVTIADVATVQAEGGNYDIELTQFDHEDPLFVLPLFFEAMAGEPPDPRATHPAVDRLLTAARETAADVDEQSAILQELMAVHQEEIVMGLPFLHLKRWAIAREGVNGLEIAWNADQLYEVWLEG